MGIVIRLALLIGLVAFGYWVVRTAGWRFALRRLLQATLILVVVSFATSWMLTQLPGDPCITALGTAATDEAVAACREDRKLDESVFTQYADWAGGVVTGDLGNESYARSIPLTTTLSQRLPRTLALWLYSQVLALLIAVPGGIWAAYQSGRRPKKSVPRWSLPAAIAVLFVLGLAAGWQMAVVFFVAVLIPLWVYNAIRGGPSADNVINTEAFVLLAVPVFVLGETLRYQFAIKWSWYDLVGYVGPTNGVWAHVKSIWLPAAVLGLAIAPVYLRLLRSDMIQNLQQDFVLVAKAKGLPNWWVLLRHAVRPSTLTLLTVAGLNIAQLVNGAIVVEFIFDLDGMGSFLIEKVASREFFPVQTIVALVAVLFVVANTVIDLVYTAVDPG